MSLGQRVQDEKDGAALRRLREALPSHRILWVGIHSDETASETKGPLVWAVAHGYLDEGEIRGSGATIAEAADKCREALG
jgi:hypothetical protein